MVGSRHCFVIAYWLKFKVCIYFSNSWYFRFNTDISDFSVFFQCILTLSRNKYELRSCSPFSLCLYVHGTDLRFPLHARSFRNTCFPARSAAALWGQRHSDQTLSDKNQIINHRAHAFPFSLYSALQLTQQQTTTVKE